MDRNMSARGHRRKAKSGLSQTLGLLIGEREKNTPFSTLFITIVPLDISVEQLCDWHSANHLLC